MVTAGLGSLGVQPVVRHREVLGLAAGGGDLPPEVDLGEGDVRVEVAVADQPADGRQHVGHPGSLVVVQHEGVVAAAVPDGVALTEERRVADDLAARPLAVVDPPTTDIYTLTLHDALPTLRRI